MPNDCVFCKIVAGKIPSYKIYEDNDILAFLDIGPISDGHTIVIPKEHYENIHSCSELVLSAIASKLGLICRAVIAGVDVDSYNVLCNNGQSAGQVVGHLHFHIIPRKSSDGVLSRWNVKKYQQGQAEIIAEKIKSKI